MEESSTQSTRSPVETELRRRPLDRGFVGAAVAIGAAYCVLIVAVGHLVGKEAAGIAGAALTAVVVAILREFETLRFRRLATQDRRDIQIPRISFWYLVLVAASMAGIVHSLELLLSPFVGLGARAAHLVTIDPKSPAAELFSALFGNPWVLLAFFIIQFTGYFVAGMLCGRLAPNERYTYAVLAALLNLLFNVVLLVSQALLQAALVNIHMFPKLITSALWPGGVTWLVMVFAAFLGAVVGFRLRGRASISSVAAA